MVLPVRSSRGLRARSLLRTRPGILDPRASEIITDRWMRTPPPRTPPISNPDAVNILPTIKPEDVATVKGDLVEQTADAYVDALQISKPVTPGDRRSINMIEAMERAERLRAEGPEGRDDAASAFRTALSLAMYTLSSPVIVFEATLGLVPLFYDNDSLAVLRDSENWLRRSHYPAGWKYIFAKERATALMERHRLEEALAEVRHAVDRLPEVIDRIERGDVKGDHITAERYREEFRGAQIMWASVLMENDQPFEAGEVLGRVYGQMREEDMARYRGHVYEKPQIEQFVLKQAANMINSGVFEIGRFNFVRAAGMIEGAIKLYHSVGDMEMEAAAIEDLEFVRDNFETQRTYYTVLAKISGFKAKGDLVSMVFAMVDRAKMMIEMGMRQRAIEVTERAASEVVELFLSREPLAPKTTEQLTDVLNDALYSLEGLANDELFVMKYESAAEYLARAAELIYQVDAVRGVNFRLQECMAYMKAKNYKKALEALRHADRHDQDSVMERIIKGVRKGLVAALDSQGAEEPELGSEAAAVAKPAEKEETGVVARALAESRAEIERKPRKADLVPVTVGRPRGGDSVSREL